MLGFFCFEKLSGADVFVASRRYLGSHPNIVSLEDLFVCEHYDELYIVMELLDSDLHRIIQSPQTLGDAHHRYFMFQLLKGVKVRTVSPASAKLVLQAVCACYLCCAS